MLHIYVHVDIPELSGRVITGFISSALTVVILLLALLLVYIGIKFYKKRNQ